MLYCGRCLYALRRESNVGKYSIIRECYVLGLMNGEVQGLEEKVDGVQYLERVMLA